MSLAFLDHLAIAATDLTDGAARIEAALGVPLQPGGKHAAMGTHNRLLSLGPDEYLEVIAIDPAAPAPGRPRWFALDSFQGDPAPRAWIAQCRDLPALSRQAPAGIGSPMDFQRDTLRWQMAVPDTGVLPFDGVFPALIGWGDTPHPAARLTDVGVRLRGIEVIHPDAAALQGALERVIRDPRVHVIAGETAGLRFFFDTPQGERVLA